MSFLRKRPEKPPAVLAISSTEVEWLETSPSGEVHYAMASVEDSTPVAFVNAAQQARREAGGTCTRHVLVLRGDLISQKILELPSLPRRELVRVMERKAARFLGGASKNNLYACSEQDSAGDKSRRWSMAAIDHARINAIVVALRAAGLHTRRITGARFALLDQAMASRSAEMEPSLGTICVAVGLQSIQVSLLSADNLHLVDTLEGNFLKTPQLAASLLQSLSTTAGFWRRMHRGARIAEVVLIGLNGERSALLSNAIHNALPEAQLRSYPEVSTELGEGAKCDPHGGRVASLRACLINGKFSPQLSFKIPMRGRSVVLASATCFSLALASFHFVNERVVQKIDVLEQEIQTTSAARSELASLVEQRGQVETGIERIENALERSQSLRASGADVEGILGQLMQAIDGRAGILNISLGAQNSDQRLLRIEAVAEGDEIGSIQDIGEIQRALESMPMFQEVRVELPSRVTLAAESQHHKFQLLIKVEQDA